MKIALVILHADPKRGGAERYTADIAGALLGRGHEVSVLAGDFPASIFSSTRAINSPAWPYLISL